MDRTTQIIFQGVAVRNCWTLRPTFSRQLQAQSPESQADSLGIPRCSIARRYREARIPASLGHCRPPKFPAISCRSPQPSEHPRGCRPPSAWHRASIARVPNWHKDRYPSPGRDRSSFPWASAQAGEPVETLFQKQAYADPRQRNAFTLGRKRLPYLDASVIVRGVDGRIGRSSLPWIVDHSSNCGLRSRML